MPTSQVARRLFSVASALVLAAVLLAGPLAPRASAGTPVPLVDVTFATLLNTKRLTLGVGALTVDPQLSNVALGWSQNMANTGVMSHNPNVRTQVVGWSLLGENVGYGNAVQQIFDALVASPVHLRNISDGNFTRVGIATVSDATGRLWTTHVFMRPGGSTTPAPPAAAPLTSAAPAPAPTRATRPAPTTAAPTTARPPAAARPTVPVEAATTTTTAAPPAIVSVAGRSGSEAPEPATATGLTLAGASSDEGAPAPLLAGVALLVLVVVGAAGLFFVRRPHPS